MDITAINRKIANVTLIREQASATILSSHYQETVPFWKITWAPQHVIFHVDESDYNKVVAYRADRVFEVITEDYEV